MVGATIKIALGEEPYIVPMCQLGSAIRYLEAPYGTIMSIENVDIARKIPGVNQIIFTKEIGENSTPIHCSNDRIGYVIAQGNTAAEAAAICEKAINTIVIRISNA